MPKSLRHLLGSQGVYDLEHPGGGSWTVAQAFDAIFVGAPLTRSRKARPSLFHQHGHRGKLGTPDQSEAAMDRFRPYRDQIAFAAALVLPLGVAAPPGPVPRGLREYGLGAHTRRRHRRSGSTRQSLQRFVATVGATLWFDVFLTQPYERLAITHRPDVETAVCLFLVGIIVTELAARNRHHHASATEEADYVGLIFEVSELVASGVPANRGPRAGAQRPGRSTPPPSLPLRGGPQYFVR